VRKVASGGFFFFTLVSYLQGQAAGTPFTRGNGCRAPTVSPTWASGGVSLVQQLRQWSRLHLHHTLCNTWYLLTC
jgi:hypothetical protein